MREEVEDLKAMLDSKNRLNVELNSELLNLRRVLEDKDRELSINKEDLAVKTDLNINLREDLHRNDLENQDLRERKRDHVTQIDRLRESHHVKLRENDDH